MAIYDTPSSACPIESSHAGRFRVVLGVFAACLVTAAPVTAQREVERMPRDLVAERLAILPFGNISGAPGDDWIGDGIVETLRAELHGTGAFEVVGPETVSGAAPVVARDDTSSSEPDKRRVARSRLAKR